MKKFQVLFIILGLIFFITALTMYLNRVVFPVQIKRIVTTQAETFLKRKVEIGTIRFSWVRGFLINKIKIYQKDSDQVFVQAENVTFGLIIIPGFKQQKITIPFINIDAPSIHLIHIKDNDWNFSDIFNNPAPTPTTPNKAPPFTITLTGIHLSDGKVRIDDTANDKNWNELLSQIELQVNLSFKGINYDLSAVLPLKQGSISAQGTYMPLTQEVDATIKLKNIKPSDYWVLLPPIKNLDFKNGMVQNMDANIHYSKDQIKATGDLLIKDLDVAFANNAFSGDISAANAAFELKNKDINAKGNFKITHMQASVNSIKTQGDLSAQINELLLTPDKMTLDGNATTKNTIIEISPTQIIKGNFSFDKIKTRKDKDGTQLVGTINGEHLNIINGQQNFSGSLLARPLTLEINNANQVSATGDIQAKELVLHMAENQSFAGNCAISNFNFHLQNPNDIAFAGKISMNDLRVVPLANTTINGSIEMSSINIHLVDDAIDVKAVGELNNWQLGLSEDKSAVVEANFDITANYPLKNPNGLTYSGTFQLHDAVLNGYPFGPYKDINITAELKTDNINVKFFSALIMDTSIKGSVSVINPKTPVLNLDVSSDKFDLNKLKTVIPDLLNQYGLEITGEASFNAQFQGLASDPLSGKITAHTDLNNTNISSSKFNQSVSAVSGSIDATPNSLIWNTFNGTYLNKKYTLTGNLKDFKNPRIDTSLDGEDVSLKANLVKTDDRININTLQGKYLKIGFDVTGNVDVPTNQPPLLDIHAKTSLTINDILGFLTDEQKKNIAALKPDATLTIDATIKGAAQDWQHWTTDAKISSPLLSIMGYNLNDLSIVLAQKDGKVSNLTIDTNAYDGKVHFVGSGDLSDKLMPFDLALNIDGLDLQKLKMDIPNMSTENIKGKFYLTTVGKANLTDYKSLQGKGSLGIREGFLTEFKIFKGLFGILNEGLRIGQVMVTDVDGNFTIENQKITTDNLRLRSPTIVLLTTGWVNFDQICDLTVAVDMTSGIIPSIAEEVLRSLQIHIFDKISNPKFTKKISVPQVINSVFKAIGILQ